MPYIISKYITVRKKNPFRIAIDILLLIIAVPVVIIAFISLCVVFIFNWLRSIIISKKPAVNDELYYLELELVRNSYVQVTLTEDELDTELTALNQQWAEQVYNKETCLYRAGTVPLIPGLHGMICCFYCKEQPDGVILQTLKTSDEKPGGLDTQLLFLQYPDLKISVLDDIGPYFLYNDKENNHFIKGFNEKEKLVIELQPIPQISRKR